MYSFLKIYIWGPQNWYSIGKNCTFWYKIVNEIKSQIQCTKLYILVQLFHCEWKIEDQEFVQLWRTVHFVPLWMSQIQLYSFLLWLYSFSVVVQLFKNTYMRTTEFVQLWKKLYILLQTPLWMNLRAKYSVPKMYSFFLWLYSFLMVVQLFKNIYMRTTELVQLWKKLYILLQTRLWMKLRGKDSVPKMYSFFLLLYSFSIVVLLFKIYI